MQLDINDIEVATQAIRLAQKRGAFEIEESAQLVNTVLRLEQLVGFNKQQQAVAEHEQNSKEETDE